MTTPRDEAPITWQERLLYAAPFAITLAVAAFVGCFDRMPFHTWYIRTADHQKYMAMAAAPFSTELSVHVAPFCWRVLTPWLVHLMPCSRTTGFLTITIAGHLGAIAALLWLLRGLGCSRRAAAAGAITFALLGPSSGDYWDYMTVDALAIALQTVVFACAVRRHGLALLPLALLCAAQKEATLIGFIFALAWSIEQRDRRMVKYALGALVMFFVVTVAIRKGIPMLGAHHNNKTYTLRGLIFDSEWNRSLTMVRDRFIAAIGSTWNVLLFFGGLQLFHPPRLLRRLSCWIVLAMATGITLIAGDVQRNVATGAFPIVIAACALEVDELAARIRVSAGLLWAFIFAAQIAFMAPMLNQVDPLFEKEAVKPLVPTCMIIGSIVLIWLVRRFEREPK